jgi:hypothetical protein
MTEAEWLACAEPWRMVPLVRTGSDRKLRLFACACCRQVLNPFAPPLAVRAVAAAEAFADGELGASALATVREVVAQATQAANAEDRQRGTGYLSHLLKGCTSVCTASGTRSAGEVADDVRRAAAGAVTDAPVFQTEHHSNRSPEWVAELASQADLLRDIFGNPFRPVTFSPAWRTDTAVALARQMYEGRDFSAMPILADALQDAGCDNADILNHCRGPGPHVRGCWVVDLVLGKQ